MTLNKVLRVVFSVLLIFIGAVLILLGITGTIGNLLSNVGLALIVAGIVAVFEETVISRLEQGEAAKLVADEVYQRLYQSPLQSVGIRLVSPVRKGYDGYYLWAISNKPQRMFFAGRSVLHRIDTDFRHTRGLGKAEDVIVRRLSQGAKLWVMFLDPGSDLIPRLAREEGQQPEQLLSDIATSIGICERLYNLLKDREHTPASLEIRLYNEVPYFAYHRVDDNVTVGFYFSSALGHTSAAYDAIDQQTKSFFEGHFLSIRSRGSILLQIPEHRTKVDMDLTLLSQAKKALIKHLGERRTEELINYGAS
jgi:hypothetical protein